MLRRLIVLTVVLVVATSILMTGPLAGNALQDTATPEASPAASPAASPEASPVASPVGLIGDVESGKMLASQCLACHSLDGTQMVGPTWLGLYGHDVELEDGTIVVADDEYLRESIVDPLAKIVKGYPAGAMPPYGSILDDQQIADIIAYIRTLAEE